MKNSWTKTIILSTALMGTIGMTNAAQARGCIKGAIVGGVAGHLANHGTAGALAGCAIGHHYANKNTPPKTKPAPANKYTPTKK